MAPDAKNDTLVLLYADQPGEETTFYSDEVHHFQPLAEMIDEHHTVAHGQHEYELDRDDNGYHEAHNNTIESVWSSLRNFLRSSRGVHKRYLPGYIAIFEWAYDLASVNH